jgi:hypothetical protein
MWQIDNGHDMLHMVYCTTGVLYLAHMPHCTAYVLQVHQCLFGLYTLTWPTANKYDANLGPTTLLALIVTFMLPDE